MLYNGFLDTSRQCVLEVEGSEFVHSCLLSKRCKIDTKKTLEWLKVPISNVLSRDIIMNEWSVVRRLNSKNMKGSNV